MPLWMKVFLAITTVLVAAAIFVLVTGGGHGPGRHAGPGDDQAMPAAGSEGHVPPPGVPEHSAP